MAAGTFQTDDSNGSQGRNQALGPATQPSVSPALPCPGPCTYHPSKDHSATNRSAILPTYYVSPVGVLMSHCLETLDTRVVRNPMLKCCFSTGALRTLKVLVLLHMIHSRGSPDSLQRVREMKRMLIWLVQHSPYDCATQ